MEPYTIDDSLMLVPLVQGANEITMEYHIPFIHRYMLISVTGILMVIGEMLFTRSRRKNAKAIAIKSILDMIVSAMI